MKDQFDRKIEHFLFDFFETLNRVEILPRSRLNLNRIQNRETQPHRSEVVRDCPGTGPGAINRAQKMTLRVPRGLLVQIGPYLSSIWPNMPFRIVWIA